MPMLGALSALPETRWLFEVRGMFGKAVKKSGLKTGDVIVQSGNYTKRTTEGEFHSDYYRPGSILELKVLRKGEPLGISVKF